MTDKPNPADFSVNEKPNDYEAVIRVEGEIRIPITASSMEEARAKARKEVTELQGDAGAVDLDEVIEARVDYVRKSPPMFRVMRDGGVMQVSVLEPGDLPRQPNERGF